MHHSQWNNFQVPPNHDPKTSNCCTNHEKNFIPPWWDHTPRHSTAAQTMYDFFSFKRLDVSKTNLQKTKIHLFSKFSNFFYIYIYISWTLFTCLYVTRGAAPVLFLLFKQIISAKTRHWQKRNYKSIGYDM